jgi:competence protein CoiA
MLTATIGEKRVAARHGLQAVCPGCRAPVIAKCGEIKAWHWSHLATSDCDPWFEPECAWHLAWKRGTPADRVEVVMGPHRADMVCPDGTVIELQHSSLSPAQVRERETFYGRMIWMVDTRDFEKNLNLRDRGNYVSFRWLWPRQWMFSITKRLIWDFGAGLFEGWKEDRLFEVRKLYHKVPCGGWGQWLDEGEFLENVYGTEPQPHAIASAYQYEGALR